MNKYAIVLFLLMNTLASFSQSLLDMLNEDKRQNPDTIYTEATFKAPRLVNGQTIENVGKNSLNLTISHRFHPIKSGITDLFGIDESSMRLGAEYGITNRIDVGIGRGNYQKLYDGHIKIALFRQCDKGCNIPVTISWFSSMAINTEPWTELDSAKKLSSRFYYTYEILIGHKFNRNFSAQFVPGFTYRNFVESETGDNIVPYVGAGARYKLTNRLAVAGEYYYVFSDDITNTYDNSLSLGFEIETGGHIFQLLFTNSMGMIEKSFIPETSGTWGNGDMRFGFNIIRNFKL